MRHKIFLGIDPSGDFTKHKGTTGWIIWTSSETIIDVGEIKAVDYETKEEYWQAHIDLITMCKQEYKKNLIVVLEDFILYKHKAAAQSFSRMETPRIIGIIELTCWQKNIQLEEQLAKDVKTRWSNEILVKQKLIYKAGDGKFYYQSKRLSKHVLDALRHVVHCKRIKLKKKEQQKQRPVKRPPKFSNY